MILVESEMYMYEEMPLLPEFFFSSFLRDRIFVSIKDELISVLHRSYVHRNAKVVKCTTYVPICHNNQVFGRVTLDTGVLSRVVLR